MSVLENVSGLSGKSRRGWIFLATAFLIIFGFILLPGCTAGPTISPPWTGPQDAPLRVATSGDYAPFSQDLEKPTGPTGFSPDLARAYAKATGRSLTWIPFRWPELAADLAADRFDMALSGITVRPDRSILGRFSLPLTTSGAIALVDAASPIASIEDLGRPNLGIAVNAGGHLERTARTLFPQALIEAIPDNDHVLPQLSRAEINVVVTDTLEAPHWSVRRPGMRRIGPLTRDRKAAWFPLSGITEARKFDHWLLLAEADGLLAALRAEHGLPDDATASPNNALLASLDERLSLMTAVAQAKRVLGSPIENLPRETRVLDAALAGIKRAAARNDQPQPLPEAVLAFYAAQIEAAKAIQRRWTQAQPDLTEHPSAAAKNQAQMRLNKEIRPALIYLGDRIADLVVENAAAASGAPDHDEVARALRRHDLPADAISSLHAALVALLRDETASPDSPEL